MGIIVNVLNINFDFKTFYEHTARVSDSHKNRSTINKTV